MKETNNPVYLTPPKKKKLEKILGYLGEASGKRCIDIGGDNGVISFFLRKQGGEWTSADLDDETVESIKGFVGENVIQTDGGSLPFGDNFFDAAVIVDFLEHIEDDRAFILELFRVLKPGALLIINVPLLRQGSILSRMRELAGYTDEKHGHLRPGYTPAGIRNLLGGRFEIEEYSTYIGFFTELIDSLASIAMLKAGGGKTGKKGNVVTREKAEKKKGAMRGFRLIRPAIEAFSALDTLLPWREGANLILKTKSLPPENQPKDYRGSRHAEGGPGPGTENYNLLAGDNIPEIHKKSHKNPGYKNKLSHAPGLPPLPFTPD